MPKAVQGLSVTVPYNDLGAVENILNAKPKEIAAFILEPVGVIPPAEGYLKELRTLTRRFGVVLIFDEIITGFRMHLGGAQAYFDVTPDLSAFGKSMGNGMPIAAVLGKKEIMECFNEVFFSTTFGGETLSLAASLKTIQYMRENRVVETLWSRGGWLKEKLEQLIHQHGLQEVLEIQGYPVRTVLNAIENPSADALVLKSFLQQECAKRGLLFSGSHNISLAHSEEIIQQTLKIYGEVFELLADLVRQGENLRPRLQGDVIQPVFRKA